jgi:D-alanine-D-alanine ligase
VLAGGLSSEREISERSARSVEAALRSRGYDAQMVAVDRHVADRLAEARVEVAFNALHGRYGEDGCIQGLLEVLAIPYTGAGVLGSALAMNKWVAKRLLCALGIASPAGLLVTPTGPPPTISLPLPVVVKPNGEGSTNGVSIIHEPGALEGALAEARSYDAEVLVEEYIPGREVTVAILHDRALAAMEVIPLGAEFHTYEVKYTPGREEFVLPAPLGADYQGVLDLALSTHRALFAGAYSRVDLRVRPDGKMFVLECNTLPGLHELGWYPAMAAHAGIGFEDLIETILDAATLGVRETSLGGARHEAGALS